MVEINFGRRRPAAVVAIDRVDELKGFDRNGHVSMGAGVTYTRMLQEDAGSVAMREAARTVGSPQIRNAGTIGGNLGMCSPAGDTLPVLAALDATVVLGSASGVRELAFDAFCVGPKRTARAAGEVILGAWVAVPDGP